MEMLKMKDRIHYLGNSWNDYQYVTNINRIDDFYVVAESYKTAQGAITRTGNNYAVNAYTGELFKLQQDKGVTNLVKLEIKTDSYEEE